MTNPCALRCATNAASDVFGVSVESLLSPSRRARHVKPRHAAMYAARSVSRGSLSLEAIGAHFNRDHTSVSHALKCVENRAARDEVYAQRVADVVRITEEMVGPPRFMRHSTAFPAFQSRYMRPRVGARA